MKSIRTLIIEDSETAAALLVQQLRLAGFEPTYQQVDTPEALSAALDDRGWDLVISDHAVGKFNSIRALRMVRNRGLEVPFIVVSGVADEETPKAILKAGATDFIPKGQNARLITVVKRELGVAAEQESHDSLSALLPHSDARFRLFYEQAPVAYQALDPEGRIVDVNSVWLAILGFRPEEVLGRWFGSFLTLAQAVLFRRHLQELMTYGSLKGVEYSLICKHNHCVNVSLCGRAEYNQQRKCLQTYWIFFNLSVVEHAHKSLCTSSTQSSQASDQAPIHDTLMPICMSCKKVRDQRGFWHPVEEYLERHAGVISSHGICPECAHALYPDVFND